MKVVEVLEDWGNPLWRLSNIYRCVDDNGQEFRFRPNDAQLQLWHELHAMNVILKSRQWGFTTWIDLIALDACFWNRNYTAGIIAHTLPDAESIFRRKILYPLEHLPAALLDLTPIREQRSKSIVWEHGSEISVSTSMRSTTLQFLHVSEFGKISASNPKKAIEITSGSLPALNVRDEESSESMPDQEGPVVLRATKMAFVESTAEGRGNAFHKMVQTSRADAERGKTLSAKEFKFHFFPWHKKKSNRTDPAHVEITAEVQTYLQGLTAQHGVVLDARQAAWYAAELKSLGGDWELMKREHPSTPDEPFEVAIVGAYYGQILAKMRAAGRIGAFPHVASEPVWTFWDLGHNDVSAVWFAQRIASEWRFVWYVEGHGLDEVWDHMEDLRRDKGFRFGPVYLPHDGRSKNSAGLSAEDRLIQLGIEARAIEIVERVDDLVTMGIPAVRRVLPAVLIDAAGCDKGLLALENYQRKWSQANGCWLNYPAHNQASNGADAFRQFAQSFDQLYLRRDAPKAKGRSSRTRNWRVA